MRLIDVEIVTSPLVLAFDVVVAGVACKTAVELTDLALRYKARGIVVGASALRSEWAILPAVPARRFRRAFAVDLFSGTSTAQFDGRGTVFALDSLSRNRGQYSKVSETVHSRESGAARCTRSGVLVEAAT